MPRARRDDGLAALARLIDEEATLRARRLPYRGRPGVEYRVLLRLRTTPELAEQLRGALGGGSISQERLPNGQPRATVLYELSGTRLGPALERLRPHLVRQAPVAERLLELLALRAAAHTAPGRPLPPEHLARCDALLAEVQALAARTR